MILAKALGVMSNMHFSNCLRCAILGTVMTLVGRAVNRTRPLEDEGPHASRHPNSSNQRASTLVHGYNTRDSLTPFLGAAVGCPSSPAVVWEPHTQCLAMKHSFLVEVGGRSLHIIL